MSLAERMPLSAMRTHSRGTSPISRSTIAGSVLNVRRSRQLTPAPPRVRGGTSRLQKPEAFSVRRLRAAALSVLSECQSSSFSFVVFVGYGFHGLTRIGRNRKDGSPCLTIRLLTLCGLAESELRHRLQSLTKTGLVIKDGDSISFIEPVDSLSQLFFSIAFDHVAMAEHASLTDLCVSAEP